MGNLEIYRAFFVAFGAMEVLTNFRYLIRKNGIELARKQHQELPKDISDRQMKAKIILMFAFGLLFLVNGLIAYYMKKVNSTYFIVTLSLFCLYALVESLYYRYWRTFGFFFLSTMVLLLFCI